LRVIGLLGVLIEAQHRGLIDTVNSILDALVNRAGFWVTRDFICTSVTGGWGKSLCYELTAHR
jgi:predicted nucleic acid-binding protein